MAGHEEYKAWPFGRKIEPDFRARTDVPSNGVYKTVFQCLVQEENEFCWLDRYVFQVKPKESFLPLQQ
jgi:hypothetical protein